MMAISIPEPLLRTVIAHARRGAPDEVCGWLAGRSNRVERVYPVPNVAEEPHLRFKMDLEIQLRVMNEIVRSGLELTATYHSHPNAPPKPSCLDLALAGYPRSAHLIVSLRGGKPQARCYRIGEEGFSPVPVSVTRP
jgi:proteasome lid subunit RPN8/RPN11